MNDFGVVVDRVLFGMYVPVVIDLTVASDAVEGLVGLVTERIGVTDGEL